MISDKVFYWCWVSVFICGIGFNSDKPLRWIMPSYRTDEYDANIRTYGYRDLNGEWIRDDNLAKEELLIVERNV